MKKIKFYIVDVFANQKYGGNQLAVFVDLKNQLSDDVMQQMATEINFAETTFIKADNGNQRYDVRIFTPEHEVPFAGHPSLGTSYILSKHLSAKNHNNLVLELKHSDIDILIEQPDNLEESTFYMTQAQPEFKETFTHSEIANELGIPLSNLDLEMPIQEITTGLPYILIPLSNLSAIEALNFDYATLQKFLSARKKYRTNSVTGHSTSFFFFTKETYEKGNHYNTRMMLLENGKRSEDAATGSANGCFLAYLLKYGHPEITATVEQGFQINRKSYIYLNGSFKDKKYTIQVGGRVKAVSEGYWYV
jgi:trans-2,3-dihydro-3-hydroxyanthranilate isomerase